MMMAWTVVILTVCMAPIGVWLFDRARGRPREPSPQPQPAESNVA
jgi:hypothetical protein